MVYPKITLLCPGEISICICSLFILQFTCSPIERPAAVSALTGELNRPGLKGATYGTNAAISRARRQQSTTATCSPNLQFSTDRGFQKKLAMSDNGGVTVVSSNCSEDTLIERLLGVRPSLIRIQFQNGYLGVEGTTVTSHDIDNPGTIQTNDACLWCESGNSEDGFRYRYFSPSMNVCTDDQVPELYLAVTANDDVIVSTSSSLNMSTFFKAYCDNQCA